ncbi:uncharacterized protein A4U43_C09F7980 [Asparagus officinalis]|uniref:GPI transamidase component PIG-T n=2 Tax=Asparagus officinalis TaxID=4686 RepID=A0A5P1E9D7_ASPOF|nr:uncharacterized protein A4U43_C09F7980 [Asparagus officinalis]
MNVGITWKLPLTWSCAKPPFYANRFLMGSGYERGSIAISLQSSHSHEWHLDQFNGCKVEAVVFQVVPWYVKVYYHTLKIFIDGKPQIVSDVVENMRISPSEDKVSPGMLELMLRFPCNMQSASLVLDFDKGFLHIDEYPPDANQGFDISSALISFPNFYSNRTYLIDDSLTQSPLLLEFQEENIVQSYTEVLLVPLTTPDFSMPYNVITFTCTVLALYFGSLLNVLRRRVGEEERLLKCQVEKTALLPLLLSRLVSKFKRQNRELSQSSSPSSSPSRGHKLILKAILVAVAAIVYFYLLNDE